MSISSVVHRYAYTRIFEKLAMLWNLLHDCFQPENYQHSGIHIGSINYNNRHIIVIAISM